MASRIPTPVRTALTLLRPAGRILALSLAIVAIAAACGGEETPTPTPFSTVSETYLVTIQGTVTKGGAPATGGLLEVFSDKGVCGETTVNADGTYELMIYAEREGRRLGCKERQTGHVRLDGVANDTAVDFSPRRRPLDLNLAFP